MERCLSLPRQGGVKFKGTVHIKIMHYIYILKSNKHNRYYIGCTSDLERRVRQHNRGNNRSTRPGIPWRLVCFRKFNNQKEAYDCEKLVKSYKGGNAFKRIVNGEVPELAPPGRGEV